MTWQIILYALAAYLMGAIPTAYLVAKKLKGIDIRQHGSGNVGATNVKRVVGPKAALFTLGVDFLKGLIPVAGAYYLFPLERDPLQIAPVLAGIMAIVGHSRSIFIGFSGGKSVITSLGVILALQPLAALILAPVAVLIMKITRYVSVGSMVGAALTPVCFWLLNAPLSQIAFTLFMAVYVIFLHRGNIQRLLKHQENRI